MTHSVSAKDFFYENITPPATFAAFSSPTVNVPNGISMKLCALTANVEFSFNGVDVDGLIKPSDNMVDFPQINKNKIWFRSTGGTVRVWVW